MSKPRSSTPAETTIVLAPSASPLIVTGCDAFGPTGVLSAVHRERHVDVVTVVVQCDDDLAVGDSAGAFDACLGECDRRRLVATDGDRLGEVGVSLADCDGLSAIEQAGDRYRRGSSWPARRSWCPAL